MALILKLIAMLAEKCETAEDAKELALIIFELSKFDDAAKE
jgi:hypothetical protein